MSDDQNNSHLEELAALRSVGLLDEAGQAQLLGAIERDPTIKRLARHYGETAALLAYEAPQIKPPPELKREIIRQLPARKSEAKIIPFASWVPYAIAACLMSLGIYQARQILVLESKLRDRSADVARLQQSNALIGLRLAMLEARDPSYDSAKIMIAWDPYRHRGVISMENLPAAQPGRNYQLWVLDPQAQAPISARLITPETGSQAFAVRPLATASPGFAITLEPSGGSPAPTGSILFAVAPSQ